MDQMQGGKREEPSFPNHKDKKKTHMESSPLRSSREEQYTPPPPEIPSENQPEKSPLSKAIVSDRFFHPYSPLRSSREDKNSVPLPEDPPDNVTAKPLSPVIVVNRSIREELSVVTKVSTGGGGGDGYAGADGAEKRPRAVSSILRRSRREAIVKRGVALGFRVIEVLFCLVSFSVMAADKTQGWSGDSFDRYKEYRYCLSVNVIAFVYSGFQAFDLAYHLIAGKHVIQHHLRYYFDFSIDQILTYLLMSASSSAATRVDDWVSNWGKDDFTVMASASVAMSFLAFVAFAFSSLISGYNLCTRDAT